MLENLCVFLDDRLVEIFVSVGLPAPLVHCLMIGKSGLAAAMLMT